VRTVSFSPDGKTLVSGSWGMNIKLWNLISQPSYLNDSTGMTGNIVFVFK